MPQQALTGSRKQLTRPVTSKMSRQPSEDDFHTVRFISEGNCSVTNLLFYWNNSPKPRKANPSINKRFPVLGLVTLALQGRPEIVRHYEYIGKGSHRDAINIKMDLGDMTTPRTSTVVAKPKACVAIKCKFKIVTSGKDESTVKDYKILNDCQRYGIQ